MGRLRLLVLLFVGACATPYESSGVFSSLNGAISGANVQHEWRKPEILAVSATGNRWSSDQRMIDFVLLKAAEEGLAAGYQYCSVVEMENKGVAEPKAASTSLHANVTASALEMRGLDYMVESPEPVKERAAQSFYRPGRQALFQMHREQPQNADEVTVLRLEEILNMLGPAYIKDFASSPTSLQND